MSLGGRREARSAHTTAARKKGGGVGEDLLPESRTWSKEEIMGAKSSRDWLSNWSLGLIGK